ncbi:TlpA family protein disulfide reductase [Undibacterium fentianense]|uniref:TlpA family protein disulfide reductase n=1 Tax=Undibacterium fentianense TaxID=2828728 RepID=A0A941IEE2_9BURK|nr:TlpA disulfide reductase family protein [Undibacterium fentianense]MBR7799307.1 TlpA family protein disulfide reductase [Undibacterium fentianense]
MTIFSDIQRTAIASLLLLSFAKAYAIEKGQIAPDFSLPSQSKQIKLSDYRGKVVYLDFWASWCAPCKKSFPWMNALEAKNAAKGLRVIAINVDAKTEDSQIFLNKVPAQFAIAFDNKGLTATQYQVAAMPSSVLIDKDGKIIAIHKGFNEESAKTIEAEIDAALAK